MEVYGAQVLAAATLLVQVIAFPQIGTSAARNMSVCFLPMDEGPCKAMLPQYYYDRYTQTCQEFSYGGCGGNDNNFETLEDCEKTCWKIKKVPKLCRMEPEEGRCRAYLKRFTFNLKTMKCEIIKGCYENVNNAFKDEASCEQTCTPKRRNKKPRNRNRFRKIKPQS